ncbi:hypothetical protein DY000_02058767 [Brassica cretica]|uniref:Uncharacterized protein n=1 Tax=Brassica cretica TaxID=69181 RepID=A0ABQ7ATB6_BRACR|nr:hypothetical protein DY000_02058767 [Brassica cretica]
MFQVMDDKKNGKAVWVPVSTRVEDHVVVAHLDYSNIENPDEFIEDYTSHLANNPMDVSRPLWEFHVLNIKTSNAESFGIGKFPHSLGYGMSLMSLLYASSSLIHWAMACRLCLFCMLAHEKHQTPTLFLLLRLQECRSRITRLR